MVKPSRGYWPTDATYQANQGLSTVRFGTFGTIRPTVQSRQNHQVAWFFRVIEQPDGNWTCRAGQHEYDTHTEFEDAIEHIKTLAADHPPAELFIHRNDGTVQRLGTL